MELKKEIKGLTEQQKKELKEAKTKEELNALVSPAEFELTDEELDAAGGFDYDSCLPWNPCGDFRNPRF